MNKAHARSISASRPLPDKLFYKIGEVSRIAEVEPYVLRYWESEFPFLKPRKSKSGQRVYAKKDLETILRIKGLLYEERYTIEGVRKRLGEGLKEAAASEAKPRASLGLMPPEAQPQETGDLGQATQAQSAPRLSVSRSDAIEHIKKRLRDILSRLT